MANNLIQENIWLTTQLYEAAEESYHEDIPLLIESVRNKLEALCSEDDPACEVKSEKVDLLEDKIYRRSGSSITSKIKGDDQRVPEIEDGSQMLEIESTLERRNIDSLSLEELSMVSNSCSQRANLESMGDFQRGTTMLNGIIKEISKKIGRINKRTKIVERKVDDIRSLIVAGPKLPNNEDLKGVTTSSPTVGIATLDIIPTYDEETTVPDYEKLIRRMFVMGVVWGCFEWISIKEKYRKFRVRCYVLENKINLDSLKEKLSVLPSLDRVDVVNYYPIYPD